MVKFIGDVHGKYGAYQKIIAEHKDTIQLGDMGVGFRRFPHGEWQANPPYDKMVAANAHFIRGNHDNPFISKQHSQCIKDGTLQKAPDGRLMMFIGGAYSIDKAYRLEEFSWWPEEEFSQEEMWNIARIYEEAMPDVMVTHDAPMVATEHLYSHHKWENSRTQQFLQALWNIHKPALWVHGHHHVSSDRVIEGTRFVCLAELEMRDL